MTADVTGGAVPIKPASTVMLVRDAATGVEVFTLHRAASLAFAAGMTAFPGGGVDPGDADAAVPWIGPDCDWWADSWRVPTPVARSQVVAAVRELYEETGVLLAGDDGVAAVDDRVRVELTEHRVNLAEVLRRHRLGLRADLLRPWARWITPPGPPRRYDTYFFLAALPEGARPDHATSEAVSGGWRQPRQVLTDARRGAVTMMPPTVAMMTDLADAESVADLVAVRREVEPVVPEVITHDGEVLTVSALGRRYSTRLAGPS